MRLTHDGSKFLADKNDTFRKEVLTKQPPDHKLVVLKDVNTGETHIIGPHAGGIVNYTRGFDALDDDKKFRIVENIKTQEEFDEGNDPYGEHDFGIVQIVGYPKVYWRINYYENRNMDSGTPTPESPETYRVLTVMLAEEY